MLKYSAGIKNVPKSYILGNDITEHFQECIGYIKLELEEYLKFPIIARSSTNVEDSSLSFAGQFESEVCNDIKKLHKTVENVINSAKGTNVQLYCKANKIEVTDIKIAVLFQPCLFADFSGVVFTKNPVNNNLNEVVIEYKNKTNDAVTAGSSVPKCMIIMKSLEYNLKWPFNELINIANRAEIFFGFPVDIEWIVSEGKLWIVQIRQITT